MKNNKVFIAIAAIALAVIVGVVGITRDSDAQTSTVRIAANLPLTGPVAAWSGEFPNGFRLGIEEESAALGLDPTIFHIDFQDNAGKPAQAATVGQKQIANGFDVYLVGSSESAKAVVDQVDPLKVPNFIVAFDPFMTSQNPARLRIMANSKVEAPLFISYAVQRKAKSVYIIHLNSAYANDEFGKIVRPALEKAGVKVMSETFDFDTKDYKTVALKAARANTDLIYICGYSFHLRPLIGDLRANGVVKGGRVVGVMDVVDFLYDGTPKAELAGLVFAAPQFDIPGAIPGAAEWRSRYEKRFGRAPTYVPAYAYDNARAIVRAYKQSGRVSVDAIRAALPFQGITGNIQVDKEGDIIATVTLAEIDEAGRVREVAK